MALFLFAAVAIPEDLVKKALLDDGAIVVDAKLVLVGVLLHGHVDVLLPLIFLDRREGIVDQVSQHLAEAPGLHRDPGEIGGNLQVKSGSDRLGLAHFILKERIHRRHGRLQRPACLRDILIDRLQEMVRLLVFSELQKAVDHLHLIEILMPLRAELFIELGQIVQAFLHILYEKPVQRDSQDQESNRAEQDRRHQDAGQNPLRPDNLQADQQPVQEADQGDQVARYRHAGGQLFHTTDHFLASLSPLSAGKLARKVIASRISRRAKCGVSGSPRFSHFCRMLSSPLIRLLRCS